MLAVRHSKDDDILEILELFDECFSKKLSTEHWLWKYKKPPYGAVSYVALLENRIIAHYGAVRFIALRNGEPLTCYAFCDVMTHSGFRGKMYGKTPPVARAGNMLYDENHMDFAFGFPSKRHAKLQTILFKGSVIGNITIFSKFLKPIPLKNRFKITIGWNTVKAEEIDKLWLKERDSYSLTLKKDSAYLYWRYRDCPSKDYMTIAIRAPLSKRLKGLIILSITQKEVNILDLLIPDRSKKELFLVLLENYLYQKGIININIWLNPKEKLAGTALKLGYETSEGFPLGVRPIRNIDATTFFDIYNFRMGDYDDN